MSDCDDLVTAPSAADCEEKIERFFRSVPKVYKAGENPVITAFLRAFATSDCETAQQIQNTKAQLCDLESSRPSRKVRRASVPHADHHRSRGHRA